MTVVLWRDLRGLRLSRTASADTVAGWKISKQGDGWIRLDAASWFLVVHAAGDSGVSSR
ncbi:hypothetical protein QQG74_24180 [Micromonospora sp. FIMYZ51]|uniref:hypothetical protein n=1 Tax=Micromonospora sp. FIMYZ51 TaxID=3051832 RepID=UPI00311D8BE3